MTRSRVYGILAGYEDQNDHDALRSDAVFKLIAALESKIASRNGVVAELMEEVLRLRDNGSHA